jgi:hypothetical protein
MLYRCLVCDIPLTLGTFSRHAEWHRWHMEQMRQVGFEWETAPVSVATHEFGEKYGASLFWLIRHLNPLVEDSDV